KEKLRRVGEEGGEVVEGDVPQLRLRPDKGAGKERWRVRAGLAHGIAGAAVFARVTEQTAARSEVFFAEGLEAVVGEKMGAGGFALPFKSLLNVIQQFAHEHGGRRLAVVANVLADIADVEPLTRGEQCFEEEIAV